MCFKLKVQLSEDTKLFLRELVKLIVPAPPAVITEEWIMFTVKTDNPDVVYAFSKKVTDSEGNAITSAAVLASLVTTFESDNSDAVSIIPDAIDPTTGTVHFGNPGVASLKVAVTKADGTVLGSGVFGVTTVVGDPSAVTEIGLTLGDLVDE